MSPFIHNIRVWERQNEVETVRTNDITVFFVRDGVSSL